VPTRFTSPAFYPCQQRRGDGELPTGTVSRWAGFGSSLSQVSVKLASGGSAGLRVRPALNRTNGAHNPTCPTFPA